MTSQNDAIQNQSIRRFQATLAIFQELRNDMPVSAVATFLMVYQNEGRSLAEYCRLNGDNPQTLNRLLLDLTDRNRWGGEGHMLLRQENDKADARLRLYFLTDKGRDFIRMVATAIA
jgi:DNA-binding MarR family transcriptional regulator